MGWLSQDTDRVCVAVSTTYRRTRWGSRRGGLGKDLNCLSVSCFLFFLAVFVPASLTLSSELLLPSSPVVSMSFPSNKPLICKIVFLFFCTVIDSSDNRRHNCSFSPNGRLITKEKGEEQQTKRETNHG